MAEYIATIMLPKPNPRTGLHPLINVYALDDHVNVILVLAGAGLDGDRLGAGQASRDEKYSGGWRSHTPDGVAERGTGLGFALYSGLALAAVWAGGTDAVFGIYSVAEDETAELMGYQWGRSGSADAFWDRAVQMLAHRGTDEFLSESCQHELRPDTCIDECVDEAEDCQAELQECRDACERACEEDEDACDPDCEDDCDDAAECTDEAECEQWQPDDFGPCVGANADECNELATVDWLGASNVVKTGWVVGLNDDLHNELGSDWQLPPPELIARAGFEFNPTIAGSIARILIDLGDEDALADFLARSDINPKIMPTPAAPGQPWLPGIEPPQPRRRGAPPPVDEPDFTALKGALGRVRARTPTRRRVRSRFGRNTRPGELPKLSRSAQALVRSWEDIP